MASLRAIRDGAEATLEAAIPVLHCYDTVPESPNLPAVIIQPKLSDFFKAFGRGTDRWEFDLIVLVQWGDSDLAQDELDGFISGAGPTSIREAVFKARTLGLAGTDAVVGGVTEYGIKTAAAVDHMGAVLSMVVHTPGTA